VLITLVFILNDQFRDVKEVRSGFWKLLSIPFTGVFFVECAIVVFSTDGGKILAEKKLYILELLLQGVSIMGYIKMYSTSGDDSDYAFGASLLSFAFLMRNLRISMLLEERKEFKVIMQMIMKMTAPLLYQFACLYIVFYVAACIG